MKTEVESRVLEGHTEEFERCGVGAPGNRALNHLHGISSSAT